MSCLLGFLGFLGAVRVPLVPRVPRVHLENILFLRTFLEHRVGPGLANTYFFQGPQIGHDFQSFGGAIVLTTIAHFQSLWGGVLS